LNLFFAFSEIALTFVLLINNLTITEMEKVADFTKGSNRYKIYKCQVLDQFGNYRNEYSVTINGEVVTVRGYNLVNDAWELGKGGHLLSFLGIWFQLSENDPCYADLISKGFQMPN
jgi:hypothetical protein